MKLAIVGSRVLAGNVEAQRLIEAALDDFRPTMLISGGAEGIDSMAAAAAKARGIAVQEFLPEVPEWERGFKKRNEMIAHHCQTLVCIRAMSATTCGSLWTANYAKRLGREVRIENIDDRPKVQQHFDFNAPEAA